MLLSTIATIFAAVVLGDTKGCAKPKPKTEIELALAAQAQWETAISGCKYEDAAGMTALQFSFSLLDPLCAGLSNPTCCVNNGNSDEFLSRYNCGDLYRYNLKTLDYAKRLGNGTVVITKWETVAKVDGDLPVFTHLYNYFWNPVGAGKFVLGYVDGNNFQCPTFINNLYSCNNCPLLN